MTKAFVVERDAVLNNLKIIRAKAATSLVIGVLKGNAYGFGLIETARLMREAGISSFAVTEPSDLLKLRDAGFTEESVLILRSTAIRSELETVIDCGGVATVGSYEAATAANALAEELGTVLTVHIEIDTGMGRYGFLPSEENKILSVFRYMKNLHVTGMYTHFANAFLPGEPGEKRVKKQLEAFMKTVSAVKEAGYDPGLLHAANSPALFRFPYTRLDAVRVGSAYTGRLGVKGNFGLRKTGYGECAVVETRWLETGDTVGYGSDHKAKKRTRIAVIPFGYSDGFCLEKAHDVYTFGRAIHYALAEVKRSLFAPRLTVEIGGKKCRVLGRVGMLHTVADVTNVDCEPGSAARFELNPLAAGMILPKRYI